jgi:hypothetical protein
LIFAVAARRASTSIRRSLFYFSKIAGSDLLDQQSKQQAPDTTPQAGALYRPSNRA